jgi:hypothetical protein
VEAPTYQKAMEKYSTLGGQKKIVKIYDGIRNRTVFRSSQYEAHERQLKEKLDILSYGDIDI